MVSSSFHFPKRPKQGSRIKFGLGRALHLHQVPTCNPSCLRLLPRLLPPIWLQVTGLLTGCCPPTQGNRHVTKAAVEFYGPDRAKWLGPLSEGSIPSYLNGARLSHQALSLQDLFCQGGLFRPVSQPACCHDCGTLAQKLTGVTASGARHSCSLHCRGVG